MFTQKLSMDCTQEQYEKYLKAELEKMGYEEKTTYWRYEPSVFTNAADGISGGMLDICESSKDINSRTYLGKFNADLFLALAAMTDKVEGGYREYYVKDDEFYSMKENGFLGANGFFRKATVSEIMVKFGEKKITCPVVDSMNCPLMTHIGKAIIAFANNNCGIGNISNTYFSNPLPTAKFKVDTWVRDITNGRIYKVLDFYRDSTTFWYELEPKYNFAESTLEKFVPKRGEYLYCKMKSGREWLIISDGKNDFLSSEFAYCKQGGNTYSGYALLAGEKDISTICPATTEEIALIDSKLKEKGKRFDKEKLELVDIPKFKVGDWFIPHKPKVDKYPYWVETMDNYDGRVCQISSFGNLDLQLLIVDNFRFHPDWCEKVTAPKHKEPIIGEMAIMWRGDKAKALCRIYGDYEDGRHYDSVGIWHDNAILYESIEQYKEFLKS